MKIPESCRAWKAKMRSGDRQRRILDNRFRDDCVDEEITNEFFRRLAEKGAPKDAHDAESSAFEVITDAPDSSIVWAGRTIPTRTGVF